MEKLRAFEIDRDDVRIGFLGEGSMRLASVRFTCLSPRDERSVDEVLSRTSDFDAILGELRGRGLVVRPVRYADAFGKSRS